MVRARQETRNYLDKWQWHQPTVYMQNVLNQQRVLAVNPYIGFGAYNTEAEPGPQVWLDYVHQHAPEITSPLSKFGQVTSYSEPRTFLVSLGVRF